MRRPLCACWLLLLSSLVVLDARADGAEPQGDADAAGGANATDTEQEAALTTWSARLLHCAETEEEVGAALFRIEAESKEPFGLPRSPPFAASYVAAVDLDQMLRDLARVHETYPNQRAQVERIVLSFNYCDVFFDKHGWDLVAAEGGAIERHPAEAPADGWRGFRAWGFEQNEARIVPRLFDENALFPSQRVVFAEVTTREQCFPDPITGQLPFGVEGWGRVEGAGAVERSGRFERPSEGRPELSCEVAKVRAAPDRILPAYEVVEGPHGQVASKVHVGILTAPSLVQAEGASPTTVTLAPEGRSLGLSGSLFETYATGSGKASVGARVSYSPFSNTYVRVGVTQQVDPSPRGRPAYTWGVGYSDWRPGTCSLELNHWGATPIDQFEIRGAQIDVGCKMPLPPWIARYLGLGAGVTFPLRGGPSYGASFSIKPGGNWFVMGGLRFAPSRDEPWSFSYGFGNWSARPYTFSLAYNNWGPNPLFHGNFDKNGSMTFAWSWAL